MSDPEVMRYTGFKEPQSKECVEILLAQWILQGKNTLGVWAAEDLVSNSFIGWFMLKITTFKIPELGFMLPKNQWDKGYATEIAQGLIDYGFNTLNKDKIVASVEKNNFSSIKVLKKIGMTPVSNLIDKENIIFFEVSKKI